MVTTQNATNETATGAQTPVRPPRPKYEIFNYPGRCKCGHDRALNPYGRCRRCQAELQDAMTAAEDHAYGRWS